MSSTYYRRTRVSRCPQTLHRFRQHILAKLYQTSVLDHLTVARRSSYRSILYCGPAPDLSSQPTCRRLCCRSTGQTDRRTDRLTDTRPFYNAYRMLCGPRNNYTSDPKVIHRQQIASVLPCWLPHTGTEPNKPITTASHFWDADWRPARRSDDVERRRRSGQSSAKHGSNISVQGRETQVAWRTCVSQLGGLVWHGRVDRIASKRERKGI